eukprot:254696-Rhodomonas_salina.1
MSLRMSQWSSSSASGRKSLRFHRWNTLMAERQSVRIASGLAGSARRRAIAIAAYSPRMGTASPPTWPEKFRASSVLYPP